MVSRVAVVLGHDGVAASVATEAATGCPAPVALDGPALAAFLTDVFRHSGRRASLRIGISGAWCRIWRAATPLAPLHDDDDLTERLRLSLGMVDGEHLVAEMRWSDWRALRTMSRAAGFRSAEIVPALSVAAEIAGRWRDGPWACEAHRVADRWATFARCLPQDDVRRLVSRDVAVRLAAAPAVPAFRRPPRVHRGLRRGALYATLVGSAVVLSGAWRSSGGDFVSASDLARAQAAHDWRLHADRRVSHAVVMGDVASALEPDEVLLAYEAETTSIALDIALQSPDATIDRLRASRWIRDARIMGPARIDSLSGLVRVRLVLDAHQAATVTPWVHRP
jgi:hypothetical protein